MKVNINYADPQDLESIDRLWGLNRATLGLMPLNAFKEYIQKKWIIVMKIDGFLTGYLQFRYTAKTQTLAIVHLCVDQNFRGQSIAEKLVDKLVAEYKSKARGIKLNCRSDYSHAIAFWARYNFQPKRNIPSRGANTNVYLTTWWYSFGGNDLFSFISNDKIKAVLDFNIIAKLMDVHIVEETKEEIAQLQSDWLVSEIEYYQTSETTSEIYRDANANRYKRSKAFLKNFPELNIDKTSIRSVEHELEQIFTGTSVNDRSDRRQVAETILSGFSYFVTLDDGILRHKKKVLDKYQLKIVTPSDLIAEIDMTINAEDYHPSRLSGNSFHICRLKPDEKETAIEMFLNTGNGEKKSTLVTLVNDLIVRPSACINTIKERNDIVAIFGYYENGNSLSVPLIRTKQYSLRQTIFIQNITDLLKIALNKGKQFIEITDNFLTDIEKNILINTGFFSSQPNQFIRGIKSGLYKSTDISLVLADITNNIPDLKDLTATISQKPPEMNLNAYLLEKLLWPIKITDAALPCFIVPIKPYYAKELFDTKAAKLDLFGVEPKLIWSKENVYYRNVNPNIEHFPARILWYASADGLSSRQKAIVCSSYLNEVVVGPAKDLFKKHQKYGIYSWNRDIIPLVKGIPEKPIKILKFSDSESFPVTVQLKQIKQILSKHGERDNNFQSPLRIKTSTFMEIYTLGTGYQIQ